MRYSLSTSLILLVAACSGDHSADAGVSAADSFRQWSLPEELMEISGLALTADERLFAVTDEVATVYEIDYESGRLVKVFAPGPADVRGDFEGIAVLDDTIWLMTSDGEMFSFAEGAQGERVGYERFVTGLGKNCELEGLVALQDRGTLALLCKDERKKKTLRIYEWSPDNGDIDDLKLPEKDMEDAVGRKQVKPSGLDIDPATGDFLIVTAGQYAVFRLPRDGDRVDVIMRLDPRRHRQAEGIAVTRDGRMIIADEGAGGRPRLAVYPTYDRE